LVHRKGGFEVKSRNRAYLTIVSPGRPALGYRLSKFDRVELKWLSSSRIQVDGKVYDLIEDPPPPIPR